MAASTGEREALLRVVMERDFDAFTAKDRTDFLRDLAIITGLQKHQLHSVNFRRGCVLAELKVPEPAVEALLDLYVAAMSGNQPDKLAELQAFLAKHKVTNLTGEFELAVQIRSQRRPIDAEPGSREILFLHGFTGDKSTFGNLPKYLGDIFACSARVFEYPTGWLSDSPSIYFLAQGFDTWFRNSVQSEMVAIVSHSMGGIVARKFLTLQTYRSRPVDDYVRQVTFIASPHDGANLASIAKRIPGLRSEQLHDLSPSSGFVAELKDAWLAWLSRNRTKVPNIRSVYSPADSVVDPPNAMGSTGDGDTILGLSHTEIVKPKNEQSDIVLTLKRYLSDAGFEPVATIKP